MTEENLLMKEDRSFTVWIKMQNVGSHMKIRTFRKCMRNTL
jgi:hypothetical protein